MFFVPIPVPDNTHLGYNRYIFYSNWTCKYTMVSLNATEAIKSSIYECVTQINKYWTGFLIELVQLYCKCVC